MTRGIPRRNFIRASAAAGAIAVLAPGVRALAATLANAIQAVDASSFFAAAFAGYYGSYPTQSNGDLWANCWVE